MEPGQGSWISKGSQVTEKEGDLTTAKPRSSGRTSGIAGRTVLVEDDAPAG